MGARRLREAGDGLVMHDIITDLRGTQFIRKEEIVSFVWVKTTK